MATHQVSHGIQFRSWLCRIAWVGLGLLTILWILLSDFSTEYVIVLLGLGLTLVLGTWVCVCVLTICYHQLFSKWYGFGVLVLALVLANWGRSADVSSSLSGLLLMGTLGLMAALPTSLALWLRRRDVSAELICLVLLAFVWCSLLSSGPTGGPIRAWILSLTAPETTRLWWLETLSCLLMLILPLGSLAFVLHLIRLALKESQSD